MINPVVQKDDLSCGVACVAFILSINYDKALQLFDKEKVKRRTYCIDIQRALEKNGKRYCYKKLISSSIKINSQGVIVFIEKSRKYPLGHFLTRANGKWMDPWINLTTDNNINNARAGFRIRLPGKPTYGVFPIRISK